MRDPRLSKLAELLVNYSVEAGRGDWLVIFGDVVTFPLAREVYRAGLEAGAHPQVLFRDQEIRRLKIRYGDEEQLDWISPTAEYVMERVDCFIDLMGAENTRVLSGLNPERVARAQRASSSVREIYWERSGKDELNWVLTRYPTHASAQEAEMSLPDYEEFFYRACLLEEEDPIQAWRDLRQGQEKMVTWLRGKERVEVLGPNVDLRMSIEGRRFINSGGRYNMPDGEIYTSPVEDSVEGQISFTYPSARFGPEVAGIRLTMEAGRVSEASAEKGEDFLLSKLELDEGSNRIGEFAIGTNWAIDRYTGDTLFDEKIGGTVHLALGQGIEQAGGVNKSTLHWDLVTDMSQGGRILVDGELFYENGEFKI